MSKEVSKLTLEQENTGTGTIHKLNDWLQVESKLGNKRQLYQPLIRNQWYKERQNRDGLLYLGFLSGNFLAPLPQAALQKAPYLHVPPLPSLRNPSWPLTQACSFWRSSVSPQVHVRSPCKAVRKYQYLASL